MLTLAGCTSGPEIPPAPSGAAIFDRAQEASDLLPDDVDALYDRTSSRYVGEDSAGDRYWAVKDTTASECILHLPAGQPGQYYGFCGGPGVTGTTADGVVMEYASSPSQLDSSSAELVGDTLLVRRP